MPDDITGLNEVLNLTYTQDLLSRHRPTESVRRSVFRTEIIASKSGVNMKVINHLMWRTKLTIISQDHLPHW